jgi:FKBP-type peptidyl-prolyl cis-trans isomerase FklB
MSRILSDFKSMIREFVMKKLVILAAGLGLLSAQVMAATSTTTTTKPAAVTTQTTTGTTTMTGDAFLTANKNKPGVVTLPDGLQYKVLVAGKGPKPTANDMVVVHYAGKLVNGTEFDSSYKRGEPATFPVNGVIAGWVEALQLMPVGSTWELYIPASLAYGDQGAPPVIGPNETLIFKVNLIEIKKA